MRNTPHRLITLAATLLIATPANAGEVEADFNDLFTGHMRTTGGTGPNVGNNGTGTGFSEDGYDNNTGVVIALPGDLTAPGSVANFTSTQNVDINGGSGVSVGVENGSVFRRAHERMVTPLTGNTVWFSCLVSMETSGEAHLLFNVDGNTEGNALNGFGVLMGDNDYPGTAGIILNTVAYLSGAGTEITPRADGAIATDLTPHLMLGRINVDDTGDDTISVWINPADALAPGAPDVTTTADVVGPDGITSLSFEFVRRASGAASAIDHVRVSDEVDAAYFVTGNTAPPLPTLEVSGASAAPNFQFGDVYFTGPADTVSRTVTFTNNGSADLGIEALFIGNDGGGAYTLGTSPTVVPFTLSPGNTFDVEVVAGPNGGTGGVTPAGTFYIETDNSNLDMAMALTATVTAAGDPVCLNANPTLDTGKGGWIGNSGGALTTGFISGSAGAIRLKGTGDVAGAEPDCISQTIRGGQADFELSTWIAIPDFTTAAGFAPAASVADRSFQLILHSDTDVPNTAAGVWDDTHADSAMINLAYLAAGSPDNATAGFYLYNGSSWSHLPGLGTLAVSTDLNNDGDLQTLDGDTVNAYQLTISGTGFGTGAATYSISVSAANSATVAATESGLVTFHSTNITAGTPAAYTFTTGDFSFGSGGGVTPSFWIDDTCFTNGSFYPAGILAVTSQPGVTATFQGGTTTGTFQLRNDGLGQALSVTDVTFSDSASFSIQSPALPFDIAPGEVADFTYQVDASALTGESIATSEVTVTSDGVFTSTDLNDARAIIHAPDQPLFNGSFEIAGADPANDTDTFLRWEELNNAPLTRDAAGLVTGSATSAYMEGTEANNNAGENGAMQQAFLAPLGSFQVDLAFAVKNIAASTNRQFYLQLYPETGPDARLTLRYQEGAWWAYDGTAWVSLFIMNSPLLPSDDGGDGSLDPGDTIHVYRLRITASDWDTDSGSYDIGVYDAAGTFIQGIEDVQIFREPQFLPAARIHFTAQYDFCPGYWVDEVSVGPVTPDVEIPFAITHVSYDDVFDEVTLRWNVSGTGDYIIEGANDLFTADFAIGVSPGNGTVDDTSYPGQIQFTFKDTGFTGPNRFWRVFLD